MTVLTDEGKKKARGIGSAGRLEMIGVMRRGPLIDPVLPCLGP